MNYNNYNIENDIYRYYEGYFLDDNNTYDLTSNQINILDNAIFLVDNNLSLRKLSKEVGRSRSQLSRDFQSLRKLSYELWLKVRKTYKIHYENYFYNKFFI